MPEASEHTPSALVGKDPYVIPLGVAKKQPADEVAKLGYDAMMRGDGDVIAGWANKLRVAIAQVTPNRVLAEQHRKMTEPGGAQS